MTLVLPRAPNIQKHYPTKNPGSFALPGDPKARGDRTLMSLQLCPLPTHRKRRCNFAVPPLLKQVLNSFGELRVDWMVLTPKYS